MAEAPNLLYIVVVDDEEKPPSSSSSSFRYTRSLLRSALQLMGCKARHAFKISRRVFEVMRDDCSASASSITLRESSKENTPRGLFHNVEATNSNNCLGHPEGPLTLESLQRYNSIWFDLYKKLTTVFVLRENFLTVVCQTLSQYKYVGPKQREDLALACRIRERKESVTVLLCGTSGCGKSTLSSLLGSRLGVTTVVSTDSIRHMMRSYVDEKQNPLLWSSTYHAGEHLDPVAVAKAKSKARKVSGISHSTKRELGESAKSENEVPESYSNNDLVGAKQMAIEGFKAQSEMVIESLDRLITAWEGRKESVVVEGVHLSLNFVMGLMKKHPSIIPFMVYISNEEKHLERFAIRAKYMTLDPTKNKYVKYIRNIRAIQEYLCNRADKHLVPKVNNTNVDRSVEAIHATVFSCLRRRAAGEPLYDPSTNTVPLIDEEYRNQRAANSLSSKRMFQLIQRNGSSRHLMALLNTDGSVAKAWPVESVHDDECLGSEDEIRKYPDSPLYGPLQIGKAVPVNLQFGSFGISAWPSDTCGSSYAGSADGSRADGTDTGSKCFSSCCSSPRISDGPSKELKEEFSVSGSEDDDDPNDKYTDDDASDLDNEGIHEEMEGSVDEESIKSDEGYDDLVLLDGLDNGYCSDNDESYKDDKITKLDATVGNEKSKDIKKYLQNVNVFPRTSDPLLESPLSIYYLPVLPDRSARSLAPRSRRHSLGDSSKSHARSRSFPATMGKEGLKFADPILSEAP